MSEFVYYTLEDNRDGCHKDKIFTMAYRTKEHAEKVARKYLENIAKWQWWPRNNVHEKTDTRPKEGTIKIKSGENCVSISAVIEERNIKEENVKETVEVNGKTYTRNEVKKTGGEWMTRTKVRYWSDYPCSYTYNIYICENVLEFDDM